MFRRGQPESLIASDRDDDNRERSAAIVGDCGCGSTELVAAGLAPAADLAALEKVAARYAIAITGLPGCDCCAARTTSTPARRGI